MGYKSELLYTFTGTATTENSPVFTKEELTSILIGDTGETNDGFGATSASSAQLQYSPDGVNDWEATADSPWTAKDTKDFSSSGAGWFYRVQMTGGAGARNCPLYKSVLRP